MISEMNLEEIEVRSLEIKNELETATEERLVELQAEADEIAARKAELIEAEKRAKEAEALNSGEAVPDAIIENEPMEEKSMFGKETKEYRDAFIANLFDQATPEQRAILADNTNYGDGIALPVELDTAIWDQVTTAHPILADVATIRSGIAIKVTKSTPAAVTKKMDSATSTEQTFTNLEVVLVGADYHTYVTLSYAEAKMSQGAVEKFLVKEIADALGEALAKDVFARILSDAGNGQKVTPASGSTLFENVKQALALATQASRPVIYAPASQYYEIIGSIYQGSPFNMGNQLGCEVKLDNAATKVTVLDPNMFVLNVIQDTMIESQRDAKNACFVIGGYMRAEGCLRKVQAAAYIN